MRTNDGKRSAWAVEDPRAGPQDASEKQARKLTTCAQFLPVCGQVHSSHALCALRARDELELALGTMLHDVSFVLADCARPRAPAGRRRGGGRGKIHRLRTGRYARYGDQVVIVLLIVDDVMCAANSELRDHAGHEWNTLQRRGVEGRLHERNDKRRQTTQGEMRNARPVRLACSSYASSRLDALSCDGVADSARWAGRFVPFSETRSTEEMTCAHELQTNDR
jgi:hypothetical protein